VLPAAIRRQHEPERSFSCRGADGVFTSGQGTARADFCRLPTPDRLDVETLTVNVEMRVVSWLRRHGFLNDDSSEPPADPAARSALEACLLGSLGLGELSALPSRQGPTDGGHDSLPVPPRSQRRGGHSRGFDVHAGVVVSASDRDGRERLLRYCARPPLSLERLSVLDDGRIACAIRKVGVGDPPNNNWSGGTRDDLNRQGSWVGVIGCLSNSTHAEMADGLRRRPRLVPEACRVARQLHRYSALVIHPFGWTGLWLW
jgi:Putative transposase